MTKILYLGEIVSKPGIHCVKVGLPKLKTKYTPDLVIANGDAATGGFGLGKNHAMYLRKLGIDVITMGDQTYYKKDFVAGLDQIYHIVRPANFPPGNPGRGWKIINLPEKKVAIVSLLGQAGFQRVHASNPFTHILDIVKRLESECKCIILDFHSVTTAEKAGMSLHVDGRVSAIIGSGLRALSGDAELLAGGTASITDAGRTGSALGVGGMDPQPEIEQYVKSIPVRSQDFWQGLEIQGVYLELDSDGKAHKIESFRHPCAEPAEREKSSTDAEDELSPD